MSLKIGSKIRIISDNPNYKKWINKTWIVESIENEDNHSRGYDTGVGGNLISCKNLPVSLYDWEFEEV